MSKDYFSMLVIGTDMICVIICLVFILMMEKRSLEYSENFTESTIEMNDFAIELTNLPSDDYFLRN